MAEAVQYSEEGRTKCIGLTIETRPDYCLGPHLRDMLSYGCTRLEIGLQVCDARAAGASAAAACACAPGAPCHQHPPPPAASPPAHAGQSVYEDVARDTNRGHTVEAVKDCFCLAKDAGFKV